MAKEEGIMTKNDEKRLSVAFDSTDSHVLPPLFFDALLVALCSIYGCCWLGNLQEEADLTQALYEMTCPIARSTRFAILCKIMQDFGHS